MLYANRATQDIVEDNEADREKLQLIARRSKSSQAAALRARIVLCCSKPMNNSQVAQYLHVANATVGKWRRRFVEKGMEGAAG